MKILASVLLNNERTSMRIEFNRFDIASAEETLRNMILCNHKNEPHNKSWYILRTDTGSTISSETLSMGEWYQGITQTKNNEHQDNN